MSLLFLSSCAECEVNADCPEPNDICFRAKCEEKECVLQPILNCCGNNIPEKVEGGKVGSKCTCPEDYGLCEGSDGEYLEFACDENNKCSSDINPEKVKVVLLSDDLKHKVIEFKLLSTFNQPFNLDKDLFLLKIDLKTAAEQYHNLKVTKIELSATNKERQTLTLAEKEVDRVLWTSGSVVEEALILDFPTNEKEEELGSLRARITIEYEEESRGQLTKKTEVVENRYRTSNFIYADPDVPRRCPESCDDGNPATADSCSEETGYFCEHTPIPGKCGNYLCEEIEDKCTCEQDCGPCGGEIGDYMEYVCSKKKCVSRVKSDLTLEPITKLDDRALPFGKILAKYKYDLPFSMTSSWFKLELELQQLSDGYSDVEINTVRVLEKDEVISELENVDKLLDEEGDSATISLPATFYLGKGEQRTRTASLRVWYTYEQEKRLALDNATETYQKDYTQSLGKIDFINPELT